MVKTRTVVQTRTHAQKYFQKLAKASGGHGDFMMDDGDMGVGIGSGVSISIASTTGSFGNKQGKRARRSQSPPVSGVANDHYVVPYIPSSVQAPSPLVDQDGRGLEEDEDNILPPKYYSMPPTVGSSSSVMDTMASLNSSGNRSSNTLPVGLRDLPASTSSPPGSFFKRSKAGHGGGEFKAAQLLVTSTSGSNAVLDLEGAQMLSSLRQDSSISKASHSGREDSTGSASKLKRSRPVGLTLSIVNPSNDWFNASSRSTTSEPGTPWDAQIKALHSRFQSFQTPSSSSSNSNFQNLNLEYISVSTPAEQKQFVAKVQKLIRNGDVSGLSTLIEAALQSCGKKLSNSNENRNFASFGDNVNDLAEQPTEGAVVDGDHTTSDSIASSTLENLGDAAAASANKRMKISTNSSNVNVSAVSVSEDNAVTRVFRQCTAPLLCEAISLDLSVFSPETIFALVAILLSHGASVLIPNTSHPSESSPLHLAAQQGLTEVGSLLLQHGAIIDSLNKDGNAPVHLAAIAGHGQFLDLLADYHANVHLRNAEALSAIDLAGYASKDPGEREVLRRLLLSKDRRLRTLILYHPDFLTHSTRKPSDWEGPDRLSAIIARLRDKQEFPAYELEISDQFEKADVSLLGRVHSPEYLAFVNDLHKQVQKLQHPRSASGSNTSGLYSSDTDPFYSAASDPRNILPFTPQVQRALLRQNANEVKPAENCDTSFSLGTLNAARRAAGAVAHAIDNVLSGNFRNAFCSVRPPGHHSGYQGLLSGADSCGFCIFNNVAAGAFHALEEHKCERVAIVDLDIHHGNGTEEIVRMYPHPSRLFFFSVHLYDHEPTAGYHFYPGTGERNDYMHNIINVPILPMWRNPQLRQQSDVRSPSGVASDIAATGKSEISSSNAGNIFTSPSAGAANANGDTAGEEKQLFGREAYCAAISQRLLPTLRAFHPDVILLSMGFDAARGDVGNCRHMQSQAGAAPGMDLLPEDFAWVTTEILKIADICCQGRVVSVLEGGYGEYEHHASSANNSTTITSNYTLRSSSGNTNNTQNNNSALNFHNDDNSNSSSSSYGTRNRSQQHRNNSSGPTVAEAKTIHCSGSNKVGSGSGAGTASVRPGEIDAWANRETLMNRQRLAEAVAAHVHRLIDPYGPLRISSSSSSQSF
jgi:acetoin utilization deacetylase AcuC-like enzyme